jgi:hypothetical protein
MFLLFNIGFVAVLIFIKANKLFPYFLTQFNQNAIRAFRMQESNEFIVRSFFWDFV